MPSRGDSYIAVYCEVRNHDPITTGSGFHQVLLMLAFMFARPSSLILLDEPDAHLQVLLQKQLCDILRGLCHERTHFFSLKAIRPELKAALLLDGDNRRLPDREISADGLTILRWDRYVLPQGSAHGPGQGAEDAAACRGFEA